MRKPLSIDDVEEFDYRARRSGAPREAAEQLVAWAQDPHPEDDEEVSPATLLVMAGELLDVEDDHKGALGLFRRAADSEGDVPPDVRCYLHRGLLETGDVDGARKVADELRHARPTNPDVYVMTAENYELAGDLGEANRWLNLGLRRVVVQLQDGEPLDADAVLLLVARRRVRQALGFPPDEFDDHPLLPPPPE